MAVVKGYRGSAFFGDIRRDADGTYHMLEHGERRSLAPSDEA